jgi:hypothetical protein
MTAPSKCSFDPDELRVLRKGFEDAATALDLSRADIRDLSALAVAVFGIIRGVDLDDSERIVGLRCEDVSKVPSLGVIRLWITVTSTDHDRPDRPETAGGMVSVPSRAILRTAFLSSQRRRHPDKVRPAPEPCYRL